jgi:hypothetical protein
MVETIASRDLAIKRPRSGMNGPQIITSVDEHTGHAKNEFTDDEVTQLEDLEDLLHPPPRNVKAVSSEPRPEDQMATEQESGDEQTRQQMIVIGSGWKRQMGQSTTTPAHLSVAQNDDANDSDSLNDYTSMLDLN